MKTIQVLLAVMAASWCIGAGIAHAGPADSIDVAEAITLTLQNHPAIRQAEYGVSAAWARMDAERSARYPDVSIGSEYARIGPVPEFDLPGEGPLELAPRNNYDFHVGLKQTLYDFGKTDAAIRVAETSRQAADDNIDLVKFSLAYQTINVFNSILILHQRITVLDEELGTLEQHLAMSVKKVGAGTAIDFDTLTIQVRIAVAQSDRIDAAHALSTREIMFRQLTGIPPDAPVKLRGSFASDIMHFNEDSLIAVAGKQRPELILARDAETNAAVKSRLASLGDKPLLALNVATGFKNGYEPNLNTWRGNYAAGLQLKIPVFNGHATKHRTAAADADVNAARAHTADLERQIQSEVLQAVAGVTSNLDKITSTETQLRQAEDAVSMARVRYAAGVITNLDLLDAETTLSQAKLIRLRAFYDYTESLNALDRATGRKVW